MEKFFGFPPVFDDNSKILILGSFPSVKSRQQQFYYGNKQNRFWKTLCSAFDVQVADVSNLTIEEKKKICLQHGIALWDVVESCEIRGSMDSDIKNFTLVDLRTVLGASKIEKILCNGQKAYQLTTSIWHGNLPIVQMPSTSPANVRFDKDVWITELKGEKV